MQESTIEERRVPLPHLESRCRGRIDDTLTRVDVVGDLAPVILRLCELIAQTRLVVAEPGRPSPQVVGLVPELADLGAGRGDLGFDGDPALSLRLHRGDIDLLPGQVIDPRERGRPRLDPVEGRLGVRRRGGALVMPSAQLPQLLIDLTQTTVVGEAQHVGAALPAVRAATPLRDLTADGERSLMRAQLRRRVHADVPEALLESLLEPAGEGRGQVVEPPGERLRVGAPHLGEPRLDAFVVEPFRGAHRVDGRTELCQMLDVDQKRPREAAEREVEGLAPWLELRAHFDEFPDERKIRWRESDRLCEQCA